MSFRTVNGYKYSENLWRMVNRDGCVVGGPSMGLPYTTTAPIRAGDASTILVAWLWWYHNNVEPLSSPVWGWSETNDVPNSNHLSGTAVDINAPRYPWGTLRMPSEKVTVVRRGLAMFEGTVFWGRGWSKPDEMHYQLGFPEGDKRIAAFAKRLSDGHLNIYGQGGGVLPEEDTMPTANEIAAAVWAHRVKTPDGKRDETAGNLLSWTDQHAGDALDQLAGPGTKDQRGAIKPTGWPQLGTSADGAARSLVDGTASALSRLAALEAKVDRLLDAIEQQDKA